MKLNSTLYLTGFCLAEASKKGSLLPVLNPAPLSECFFGVMVSVFSLASSCFMDLNSLVALVANRSRTSSPPFPPPTDVEDSSEETCLQ